MTAHDAEQVETLAEELREMEMERQRLRGDTIQSADTPRTIAADVLASPWLADLIARERASVLTEVADRLADWEFPPGSDALEPMHRLVTSLRAQAATYTGSTDDTP